MTRAENQLIKKNQAQHTWVCVCVCLWKGDRLKLICTLSTRLRASL